MTERSGEHDGTGPEGEHRGPTVRDRRRIDPQTYQVREPQETAAPHLSAPVDSDTNDDQRVGKVSELEAALAERTSDLQRVQAEYVNYKRRVDRDRDVSRKSGIEGVLKELLPVLDDLRSSREHGELTGAFKAVGDEVERVTGKYGLVPFGQKGDPFDPHIHEALLHAYAEGIEGPTCVEILQPGYKVDDRILRPARVAVAEPAELRPEPVEGPPSVDPSPEPVDPSPEPVEGPGDGLRPAQPVEAQPADEPDAADRS